MSEIKNKNYGNVAVSLFRSYDEQRLPGEFSTRLVHDYFAYKKIKRVLEFNKEKLKSGKVAIYPYGIIGNIVYAVLELEMDIKPTLVVDNGLADDRNIFSTDALNNNSDLTVVFSCE